MPNRRRWKFDEANRQTVPLPVGAREYSLFFFTVTAQADGTYLAEQVPDLPPESTDENTSDFALLDAFMFRITWLTGKPPAESEARRQGIMAVYDTVLNRMSPEGREEMLKMQIGIGHIPSEAIQSMEET